MESYKLSEALGNYVCKNKTSEQIPSLTGPFSSPGPEKCSLICFGLYFYKRTQRHQTPAFVFSILIRRISIVHGNLNIVYVDF